VVFAFFHYAVTMNFCCTVAKVYTEKTKCEAKCNNILQLHTVARHAVNA